MPTNQQREGCRTQQGEGDTQAQCRILLAEGQGPLIVGLHRQPIVGQYPTSMDVPQQNTGKGNSHRRKTTRIDAAKLTRPHLQECQNQGWTSSGLAIHM